MNAEPEAPHASVIDIRLREIGQLFNTLDPSPFQDRDLDADAEDHIVEWARELPGDAPLAIRIHMPAAESEAARDRDVGRAIANYFAARATRQRLRSLASGLGRRVEA